MNSTRYRSAFIGMVVITICVMVVLVLNAKLVGIYVITAEENVKDCSFYHFPGALFIEENESSCHQPRGGFKAWNQGVVTLVRPPVVRNCSKLLDGDEEEQERVGRAEDGWVSDWKESDINCKSCTWLKEYLWNNLYNSELERNFPLAFSFIIYESPEQFLRLFKLLYR